MIANISFHQNFVKFIICMTVHVCEIVPGPALARVPWTSAKSSLLVLDGVWISKPQSINFPVQLVDNPRKSTR
jgi:hypothetical protein